MLGTMKEGQQLQALHTSNYDYNDDLIATGGTLVAAENLIANIPGSSISAHACIFEIDLLKGRDKVTKPMHTLIHLKDIE